MDKKQKTNRPVVMDATGKGDFDTNGRGSMLGTLDNSTANPGGNMATLRPGSVGPGPGGEGAVQGSQKSLGEDQEPSELEKLFNNENLSEEFMNKASVIFEAAVNEKVSLIKEHLLSESAKLVEEEVQSKVEDLAVRLDEYLNYAIEEWMNENKLAVENGIRTEVAESFMNGLKTLFETHYVEVPEAKHDILEDLFVENQKLEETLNEQIKNNVELNKVINESVAKMAFLESVTDMTQVDAERLASLAESIEFNNVEEFKSKLAILKENYLKAAPVAAKEPDVLTEQKTHVEAEGPMSVYVNALSRQLKKI